MKGHDLKFPSNKFIGENYVDQLAVLQVVDGMIAHGGNNTFCETMYFGVPSIIMPIIADQVCFFIINIDLLNNNVFKIFKYRLIMR